MNHGLTENLEFIANCAIDVIIANENIDWRTSLLEVEETIGDLECWRS